MTRQEAAPQMAPGAQSGTRTTADLSMADLHPRAPVVSLREARERLDRIESFELTGPGGAWPALAGLPSGYRPSGRRAHPLLVLFNASESFGSAVEMSRVLAVSKETAPCIVINIDGIATLEPALLAELVAQCAQRYRVGEVCLAVLPDLTPALLRAHQTGIAGVLGCIVASAAPTPELLALLPAAAARRTLAWTTVTAPAPAEQGRPDISWRLLPEASAASIAIPALLHGLRSFWPVDHRYGDEIAPLSKPAVMRLLCALAPLLRLAVGRKTHPATVGNRHIVRAQRMGRDFEIFVALPASAGRDMRRRYPTLVALDSNGCFATVADISASLARAGEIEETIVIGIGSPRTEGELEFGYRRFEELSAPVAADYRYEDGLGRFFRSAFALRGEDARKQLGRAGQFHDFIANELLPRLAGLLPIDAKLLTLLGHSAAGAFVGYALAQPQSPFRNYLCLSPGVNISGEWMLQPANLPKRRPTPARVFCAIGAEELANPFNQLAGIPRTQRYVDALRDRGVDVRGCHTLDGETHTSVFARALTLGLRTLVAPRQSVDAGK